MVEEMFIFMVFRLMENAFDSQFNAKFNRDNFTLLSSPSPCKTFPKVFTITTQAQGNYSCPSKQSLFLYNLCRVL